MTDQSTYDVAVRQGQFEHSYARLPERCYARLAPTAVRQPRFVQFNYPLAEELGLDAREWTGATGVAVLAGNCLSAWAQLAVLSTPFTVRPEYAEYSNPPAPSERVYQTFCGI